MMYTSKHVNFEKYMHTRCNLINPFTIALQQTKIQNLLSCSLNLK